MSAAADSLTTASSPHCRHGRGSTRAMHQLLLLLLLLLLLPQAQAATTEVGAVFSHHTKNTS